MKIDQQRWTKKDGWKVFLDQGVSDKANFVLAFGGTKAIQDKTHYAELKKQYPKADIVTCSTAGEILGTEVTDDTIVVSAISFRDTTIRCATAPIKNPEESAEIGSKLAKQLPSEDLVHALIFTDGLSVNGSALAEGLRKSLPEHVSVTGGLVGDGANFKNTVVGLNAAPTSNSAVLIGFYGSKLKVGYGSFGGWDAFGPERMITKSKYNVLYELDDKPALELYKKYLGDKAKELPSSGLLFPLKLTVEGVDGENKEIVRTLLAIDEKKQSMTFAGDMPEGTKAQLMKANLDRLIDGANNAAKMSIESVRGNHPELAILISCVGRKLVLKERIEEETEAVAESLGKNVALTGFYSYGEICPTAATEKQCQLHNQTMTITTLRESD
ncbi:MAG: FIST N-terminal domain-containing protein [Patescibacteria group bacterium]